MIKLAFMAFGSATAPTKLLVVGAMVLSVVTAGGVIYHHIWRNGYDDALAAIAKQDRRAIAKATEYRGAFRDCNARGMRWDQSTGKCSGG